MIFFMVDRVEWKVTEGRRSQVAKIHCDLYKASQTCQSHCQESAAFANHYLAASVDSRPWLPAARR